MDWFNVFLFIIGFFYCGALWQRRHEILNKESFVIKVESDEVYSYALVNVISVVCIFIELVFG